LSEGTSETLAESAEVGRHQEGRLEIPDVLCGGFPCQPVSVAGSRKGDADDRWLWPEFLRAICEVRPRYALVENVPGLLSTDDGRLARRVFGDLAEAGYDSEWDCVSAQDVGAPHLRRRIFIVAYPRCLVGPEGTEVREIVPGFLAARNPCGESAGPSKARIVADTDQQGSQRPSEVLASEGIDERPFGRRGCALSDSEGNLRGASGNEGPNALDGSRSDIGNNWTVEPDVGRVAYGVPNRVDRLKCLGNAVVPQVAEYIGRLIMEADRT